MLPATDVLYVTRVQKERFTDEAVYESVKGAYVIDPEVMKAAKERMIVMHPLPRVGEISHRIRRRSARRLFPPDGIRLIRENGVAGHGAWKGVRTGPGSLVREWCQCLPKTISCASLTRPLQP